MGSSPKQQFIHFYVSPQGNDHWSGRRPTRPFATLERARQAVRCLKRQGELPAPVRVFLRGGLYGLKRPLVLTAADSGGTSGVTYAAYPGEQPVISGGRRITGWKQTTIHGRDAWVARCRGTFTQLWVDSRRAPRPRLPRQGCFHIEKLLGKMPEKGGFLAQQFTGQDRFRFAAGDLHAWHNLEDIEFVALHFWIESRIPLRHINSRTREARLRWKSQMRLSDDASRKGAPYYVENIFEELSEPGQWYHDRSLGKLFYLPRQDESVAETVVMVPRLPQLVILKNVANIAFEGLTFSHSEWVPGPEARTASPQAACHIPGALQLRRARRCAIRNCRLTHLGSYAVEVAEGSGDIAITGNQITDLAAGGVKIWHTFDATAQITGFGNGPDQSFVASADRNLVADNEIADGGHRWRQAVGVLIGKCSGNRVEHNCIHDFDYSGISVGWTWGYAEGHAYGNVIEHNHVHHIGRGVLSDMGAIYLLGVAPGTRVRYNLIHDVEARGYGGWGIYLDEGSSHVLVENNIVYRTKSEGLHQHYGRENLIRNNIFALGREGQWRLGRNEPHPSLIMTRNIFLGHRSDHVGHIPANGFQGTVDFNLYYDLTGKPRKCAGQTWRQWRARGWDTHSLLADPCFVNPLKGDFRLRPRSPALQIGFVPFSLQVGPEHNHSRCVVE